MTQAKPPHVSPNEPRAAASAGPAGAEGPPRFGCGHEKSPENTYGSGARSRCRTCTLKSSRAWREKNAEHRAAYLNDYRNRKTKLDRSYRRQNRLAYQLYYHLRKLMKRDGAWPSREEREGGLPE